MDAFESLHTMVRTDPDAVWPRVLALIGANGDTAEAQDLIQDFVYEHDDQFIDRIEAAALADSTVRGVVLQAYVGGFATTGAIEFHRLQDRLGQLDHPDRPG
ncbi:MAG: hypothetical protein M3406_09820 [Chloroflexota bacterium]|nr:hypothetical protein [Chloroflexota bacterium]